jgi:hypothetical protein
MIVSSASTEPLSGSRSGPVLAQGRQLHPNKPTTPRVTSIGSSVPVPDLMLEVQLVDRGTANSVRAPGLALSEIKNRERNSGFAGSRVALLLYSQPGHRQNRSPRARSSRQALTSSIRRIGTVPGAGSSAARSTILTASNSRLPRISISCSGHLERSSPARDTVSSETTRRADGEVGEPD